MNAIHSTLWCGAILINARAAGASTIRIGRAIGVANLLGAYPLVAAIAGSVAVLIVIAP
jgi:hypothetical protein